MNRLFQPNVVAFPVCLMIGVLLSYSILSGQNDLSKYDRYPPFKEVVDHFYDTYAPSSRANTFYDFRKDEIGYEVFLRNSRTYEVEGGTKLLWSLEKGSFQNLKLPLRNPDSDDAQVRRNAMRNAGQFDRHPFYGYDNWPADVVRIFRNGQDLSSRQINGLGRAYAATAEFYVHERSGRPGSDHVQAFQKDLDPTVFTDTDLSAYERNMEASIREFQRLDKQDPGFQLIVGSPRIKAANQHTTAYLDLMLIQQSERAKKWLKPGIYPALYLQMAANLLNSCPQGAILFTNGDNDTFPLWYLQETEGVRKDVAVINLALLNDGSYVRYVLEDLEGKQRPKVQLPVSAYQGRDLMVLTVKNNGDKKSADAKTFFQAAEKAIKKGDPSVKVSKVALKAPKGEGLIWSKLPKGAVKVDEFYLMARQGGAYWLRQDLFLMDVLMSNAWERPICFSAGVHPSNHRGLNEYIWQEGLISRLYPAGQDQNMEVPLIFPNLNLQRNVDLFLDVYKYDSLISWGPGVSIEKDLLRTQLRHALIKTLGAQDEQKQFDATPVLLDIFINQFMVGQERKDPINIIVANCAIHAGSAPRARKILNSLFSHCEQMHYMVMSGREKDMEKISDLADLLRKLQVPYKELGEMGQVDKLKKLFRQLSNRYE